MTAPAPVMTPQPRGASISSGSALSTFTAVRSGTMLCVAKLDWPKKCEWILSEPQHSAVDPSRRWPPKLIGMAKSQ